MIEGLARLENEISQVIAQKMREAGASTEKIAEALREIEEVFGQAEAEERQLQAGRMRPIAIKASLNLPIRA